MLTLIKHLTKLKIKNILYIHESGDLNIELLNLLSAISPEIWILVITTDSSLNRYANRSKFDVAYSPYMDYKPFLKFDVGFIPRSYFSDSDKNRSHMKNIVTMVPFGYEDWYYDKYDSVEEFYLPAPFISWLPLSAQGYLSKYKIFADRSIKFIIGSFNENWN